MTKTIHIHDVPEDLHDAIQERAAERRTTVSEYLITELTGIVEKPTLAELAERLKHQETADPGESAAEIIRRQRGPIP